MIPTLYDCFKHWSDGRAVYIVSDTHFDDQDCKYMCKTWPTPEEHIQKINRYTQMGATLIHLGDVGDPTYMNLINAKYKVLITGNHDAGASIYKPYFDEVYTGPLMIGNKLILSHEPLLAPWAFNIHGHDHNIWNHGDQYHFNCAANVVDFNLINLEDLIRSGVTKGVTDIHKMTVAFAREGSNERPE